MIQQLSGKYKKHIAWPLFIIFQLQLLLPLSASAKEKHVFSYYRDLSVRPAPFLYSVPHDPAVEKNNYAAAPGMVKSPIVKHAVGALAGQQPYIGGPSSPEAISFKAVGSNNLVSLATGDFSYSIPLLDVGGYPVNLFYSGGIGMEQEASWVGLGWNINPGTVSRNMRGVPDDFNGTDLLTQTQNVKPNRTWGGDVAFDVEYVGMKFPKIGIGASLGFSHNNYLGPALEIGTRVSLTISTTENVKAEKSAPSALGLTASLGTKLSSRSGMTFSPSISANAKLEDAHMQGGIGLSTSYNSRSGIKDINISSEMKYYSGEKFKKDEKGQNTDEKIQEQLILGHSLGSSTISFAKPSYIPALRMPMENANYSGQLELGFGFFGLRASISAMGYYAESKVPVESRVIRKPLVGYLYAEKANENKDAVMDFNRLNDAEVTPNTPIISAPQFNYDIFSIQGEGTGGSIRAYRGDMGFVRDNVTTSKEKNISVGIDIGIPFHLGLNWNSISTPTRVGGWEDGNNTLLQTLRFKPRQNNTRFENVYFKNPGESTVTSEETLNKIGRDNLVRYTLSGSNALPRLESSLEQFDKNTGTKNAINLSLANNNLQRREKRTQVITMLTADEAAKIGLDKGIKNYRTGSGEFDINNNIVYDSIARVGGVRKAHHISEINVLETSGIRYVYGLPVYSLKQKDFTFSVEGTADSNLVVSFATDEPTTDSRNLANKSKFDGYVQTQETPAYATSFLLTGLLSSDYVDVTGDGITEDDLGGAVKFNYTKSDSNHAWRTPRKNSVAASGHFNEGIRTEKKDNKAIITYGEREAWYLNSIESKSMLAIFKTDNRDDAKGVIGELDGRIDTAEKANKKLVRIDLYTKADIKKKGIAHAKPIKSVHFEYGYALCTGTPDNKNGAGKLTLKSVYFSYNGQSRNVKDRYVFNYGDTTSRVDNPNYTLNASDRWGSYKPKRDPVTGAYNNPAGLSNIDYAYTTKDKAKNDKYAAAWCLKKILLPSGGQMEVQYEADDYAYVQNRRACNMFSIFGLGNSTSYSSNNSLYNGSLISYDNYYVYIKLDQPLQSTGSAALKEEIYAKYLDGINQLGGKKQLALKLMMKMPKGAEPLTVYPEYDDYGLCANSTNKDYIYIHLKAVDGKSPLAKTAIGFLTENIPGQAFPGYEVEVDGLEAFLDMAGGMLNGLKNAFKNVDEQMRSSSKAKFISLDSSFIRFANPLKMKYGGGYRIKRVLVKDNWNRMTGQYNSVYGQDYDYTMVERIHNKDTIISSGVASYEPGIGSEENPFREIISFKNKLPLASAQYGAIEMPMLEGLYPSPNVVYSKVTVRSINRKGKFGDSTLRSAIGKQVTEFYTARDYPAYSSYTPMEIKDYNKNPFFSFFYKEIINRRTISQGFLVETNDMHGKIKSQMAFSESDGKTPLSASFHTYKNTGKNGLNDQVDFVYNNEEGAIRPGNMGVDMELMTDVREFTVKSNGLNGQLQIDLFTFGAITIPLPTFFPLKTYVENKYRAVTCTKLINYHAIEDSVVVMDKGSVISTKTIVYDAETGSPIVTKTANEFKDPVYTVNYPAYWAYSGVGLAYKNIDRQFANVNFYDGKILGSDIDQNEVFESGDELFITVQGSGSSGCIAASDTTYKLWALDKNKFVVAGSSGGSGGGGGGSEGITGSFEAGSVTKDFIFIDKKGKLFTKNGVSFRIVRSGKRNNLGLTVFSASSMSAPVKYKKLAAPYDSLKVNSSTKVVAASAMDLKEKWQTDNDVFNRIQYYTNCSVELDSLSCNGILEKTINPYIKGLVGNFRPQRSYTYYGDREGADTLSATAIRRNGGIRNFIAYWKFNPVTSMLQPDSAATKWVWNSELMKVNAKGQELETRDALNRYTTAQYGFNKNLPVALVQNARNGQSFSEGFEDYTYEETINKSQLNPCTQKYIDFSGLDGSGIVNAATEGIRAHTGSSVLKVNANTTVTKLLPVSGTILDSFNFQFGSGYILTPVTGSGTVYIRHTTTPAIDSTVLNGKCTTTFGSTWMTGSQNWGTNPAYGNLKFDEKTRQFVNAPSTGTYTFTLVTNISSAPLGSPPPVEELRSGIAVKLTNLTTGGETYMVANKCTTCPTDDAAHTYTLNLTCGNYMIEASSYAHYFDTQGHAQLSGSEYTTTGGLINSAVTCTYSKAIPATDSMLNPLYRLVPGKKMQFSAWVKESCSTPCYKTDFDKSNISIRSNGTVIGQLKRTGTIIEGWQKLEGVFTLPADSTLAEIAFINTNGNAMYVDDIRIHPYNGNMKSYVYDPRTLRLSAELDENNYASFYEYDEEGQLVRVKKETILGIKTIKETRSAKQKSITDVQ